MNVRARWRNTRSSPLAAAAVFTIVTLLVIAACEDPAGNDPNVPDDAVSTSASSEGDDGAACPRALPTCPAAPQQPSYAKDIVPLIKRDCEPCHAPGGISSDRNLTTYDNVHRIRTTVLTQVYGCLMPPADSGIPDAAVGPLNTADRLLLLQWLECHSPNN